MFIFNDITDNILYERLLESEENYSDRPLFIFGNKTYQT